MMLPFLEPCLPVAVVRPADTEALGKVVAFCNREGVPLTARGAGTNLSGRRHSPAWRCGAVDQWTQPDPGDQQ